VKYAALAPELAVERLVSSRRTEMASFEREAAEVIGALGQEFQAGRAHSDPLEYIEVLRDRGAINERFSELQGAVKDEILVFTKPPYATPPQENVAGIKVARTHVARSIYEHNVLDDPAIASGIARFIEAGEEARFVDHVPLKLVIIDEAVVMFGMQDPVAGTEDLTIMVVEHPALPGRSSSPSTSSGSAAWSTTPPWNGARQRGPSAARAPRAMPGTAAAELPKTA
jgi:hypothetical protein